MPVVPVQTICCVRSGDNKNKHECDNESYMSVELFYFKCFHVSYYSIRREIML
mgnify:CR=1 FL=1